MRALYVGCNLFGQVTSVPEISVESFVRLEVESFEEISIAHSVNAYRKGAEILLHGHGFKPKKTHKITALSLPTAGKIQKIANSDTRLFFLDDLGELFVLDFLDRPVQVKHKPNFLLKSDGNDRIVDFVSGIGINVALTNSGKVYNVPNELQTKFKATKIAAGNEHCLVLDQNGRVYSFGRGSRGQLGHGDLEDQEEPKLIEALGGIEIVQVAAGSFHSCALSKEGDVYLWGWNSDGQLGLFQEDFADGTNGDERTSETPVSVVNYPAVPKILEDFTIVEVGCGSRHSIFVSDENVVYGCGCNKFNQLGQKPRQAIFKVTRIFEIERQMELQGVNCGPAATALLFK